MNVKSSWLWGEGLIEVCCNWTPQKFPHPIIPMHSQGKFHFHHYHFNIIRPLVCRQWKLQRGNSTNMTLFCTTGLHSNALLCLLLQAPFMKARQMFSCPPWPSSLIRSMTVETLRPDADRLDSTLLHSACFSFRSISFRFNFVFLEFVLQFSTHSHGWFQFWTWLIFKSLHCTRFLLDRFSGWSIFLALKMQFVTLVVFLNIEALALGV